MARQAAPVRKTLLCAIKFWSIDSGKTPTSRSGVYHVCKKQGFDSMTVGRAEKELIREGKIEKDSSGETLRLLDDVSCSTVKLSPWTNAGYPGASLSGSRRRRRRRK